LSKAHSRIHCVSIYGLKTSLTERMELTIPRSGWLIYLTRSSSRSISCYFLITGISDSFGFPEYSLFEFRFRTFLQERFTSLFYYTVCTIVKIYISVYPVKNLSYKNLYKYIYSGKNVSYIII